MQLCTDDHDDDNHDNYEDYDDDNHDNHEDHDDDADNDNDEEHISYILMCVCRLLRPSPASDLFEPV